MISELKCPLCGGDMTEARRGFSCSKWKKENGGCKFTIWKESYGTIFNEEDIKNLLERKKIRKTNTSKTGKKYEADWYLDDNQKVTFDYVNNE